MMWDLETLGQVGRLYVSAGVSYEVTAHPEALDAFKAKLAHSFVTEAHALGVECRPRDCQTEVGTPDPTTMLATAVCRWMPKTTKVELLGGHFDGRVYDVPEPARRSDFRVPIPSSNALADDHTISAGFEIDTYRLVGWREESARWVYKIDA